MSRSVRVTLAAVAAVIALIAMPFAIAQVSLTYYLPDPSGSATRHTALYGPGMVAVVVAGLVLLLELGWLLWNLLRVPPRPLWIVAGAALLASIVVVLAVGGADRPAF